MTTNPNSLRTPQVTIKPEPRGSAPEKTFKDAATQTMLMCAPLYPVYAFQGPSPPTGAPNAVPQWATSSAVPPQMADGGASAPPPFLNPVNPGQYRFWSIPISSIATPLCYQPGYPGYFQPGPF